MNIIYTLWDVADTLIQLGIMLTLIIAVRKINKINVEEVK